MRDPARKALIWFAVLAAGLSLLAYGYPRLETYAPSPPAAVIAMLAGFVITIAGACFFIPALLFARGRKRLLAARDAGTLLARWHVSAAEWERFRAVDAARAAEHRVLINHLPMRHPTPPLGLDILVGDNAIQVGDSYHTLRRNALPGLIGVGWLGPPADPECLEFSVAEVHRFGSYRATLRVPVPAAARALGVRVYEHFAARIPPPRKPLSLRAGAAIAAFCLVAGTAALAIGWRLWEAGDQRETAGMLMFSGGTVLFFAVFTLLLALLASRMPRR